jgi:hypothetical protein
MVKQVEIEVDGEHNECLAFRPLPGVVIRGRFDLNRIPEPMARLESAKWPKPIPGQLLGIDVEGVGYLGEPLHAPEHAPIREKIEKAGMRLAPECQTFEGIDAQAWLYWMARAVRSGVAQVTKGQLPDILPEGVRKNFIMAEPRQNDSDRMTAAIERQNDLMAKLLERMAK